MRSLSTYLVAEGASDMRFLPRLLERALVAVCQSVSVDVAPVQELTDIDRTNGLVKGVCAAARDALDGATLFFYHYDGTANPQRERAKYWAPLVGAWQQQRFDRPLVAVVPVHEMEAWALADPEAPDSVAGNGWRKAGVFQVGMVDTPEVLNDPKRTLREIIASRRRTSRRRLAPDDYLPLLAERVALSRLQRLRSFQAWTSETRTALRQVGILR